MNDTDSFIPVHIIQNMTHLNTKHDLCLDKGSEEEIEVEYVNISEIFPSQIYHLLQESFDEIKFFRYEQLGEHCGNGYQTVYTEVEYDEHINPYIKGYYCDLDSRNGLGTQYTLISPFLAMKRKEI
ncbi:hypothetical protein CON36_35255 [Bacillus cereus]|uniref:Uncharacterized protein n=1 Tax=Bacillus cereus TaxID=1396 RepID=A0A9X6SS94_BACCE|nr:hypothetical protein [Bacillus cereus]PDZ94166.1 hypothetical protein CON36_35255 [Bacillus cereus]